MWQSTSEAVVHATTALAFSGQTEQFIQALEPVPDHVLTAHCKVRLPRQAQPAGQGIQLLLKVRRLPGLHIDSVDCHL